MSTNNQEAQMVILTATMGAKALVSGKYVLRGPYGEPTGLEPVECLAGETLPVVGVADYLRPACWVLVERYPSIQPANLAA